MLLSLATGLLVGGDGAGETPGVWEAGVWIFVESSGSLLGDGDGARELEVVFSYTPSEVSLTTWRYRDR